MWTWYCPVDSLEHKMLLLTGWKEDHRLAVDGKDWAKMKKSKRTESQLRWN